MFIAQTNSVSAHLRNRNSMEMQLNPIICIYKSKQNTRVHNAKVSAAYLFDVLRHLIDDAKEYINT